jgi:hypothetical protein
MKKFNLLIQISLPILMVFAMLAQTTLALALEVLSVQPSTILNTTDVNLVITGSDFQDGASVVLEGLGALSTTFISSSVLNAEVPAGAAPGVYTVTVFNPDSTFASLENALTILQPTATTEVPTPTATTTPTLIPATRPLIVVDTYSASEERILPSTEFNLQVRLKNEGEETALNVIANFTPGDFVPRKSGGVLAISEIDPGDKEKITQPLTASPDLTNKKIGALVMTVSYTDENGTAYSETFNLSLPVISYGTGPAATSTPTPTPSTSNRPQLVITAYQTDVPFLQPGSRFSLALQITNLGNVDAKRVSMILGGGSSSSGGSSDGTPVVGGISGAGGDFGDFAPVDSSNVQFLGDMAVQAQLSTNTRLIVNATAEPGAYPLKITFSYSDDKGRLYNDDQVVTLLVYTVPKIDVNFYRPLDPLFAGQPSLLPLQVVNLGRKDTILGNMKVTAEGAQFSNNVILIGALTVGGYYTLDATITPDQPGPLQLLVTIDYTDDFSQLQVITRTLSVDVLEMMVPEPRPGEGGIEGGGEGFPTTVPETFMQKLWRFVKGMFGLDSSVPTPMPGEIMPGEVPPVENPSVPIKMPKG